jgi:hypothetical protein
MDDVYFEVVSAVGKRIRTTKEHWNKIIETKHAIMKGKEDAVKETLRKPEHTRRSRKDLNVYLHYKKEGEHYICVVVKHLNGEGFIVTAYITDRIKAGEKYESH